MAVRAPRICSCGKRVASGQKCPCQISRKAERERQRPTARQRGYDGKWEKARAAFLAKPENKLCVYCGDVATLVDHKIAHKGDMKLFWRQSNWVASCRRCNSRKNIRHEGGFGNPIREYGES